MVTSRKRWPRVLLVVLVVLAVVGAGVYMARKPLLRGIGHQLVHADPVVASDAILVLSGGILERELEAADLFQEGVAPVVLMTRENEGRIVQAVRARHVTIEGKLQLHRRVLVELGVPNDRIEVLEPIVASTKDEAEAARQWAARTGATSLIVVTSSFHTARSRYVFLSVFRHTDVVLRFVPARESHFDPDTWWMDRATLREGLFEWQKTLFYRVWY